MRGNEGDGGRRRVSRSASVNPMAQTTSVVPISLLSSTSSLGGSSRQRSVDQIDLTECDPYQLAASYWVTAWRGSFAMGCGGACVRGDHSLGQEADQTGGNLADRSRSPGVQPRTARFHCSVRIERVNETLDQPINEEM